MSTTWMIRSGQGSEHIEAFLEHGLVAIGWPALGELPAGIKKEEILQRYAEKYPQDREGRRTGAVGQITRFLSEIQLGDRVVTYDRDRRTYILGEVLSDYEWRPDAIKSLPQARKVKWTHEADRDALGTTTRNTLGAIQTLFKVSGDAAKDLTAHARERGHRAAEPVRQPPAKAGQDEEALTALVNETIEKADEFIEDAISDLDWQQVQHLVAGILRAMGYRTAVSEAGPDRAVDIRASPDGLGLQEPRIFVEVKHREAQMGSKEIRAFLGGRKKGDKCLYDAMYEAERADVATTLINMPSLRRLLVEYYETLDPETRALVPLRRLYWPDARG